MVRKLQFGFALLGGLLFASAIAVLKPAEERRGRIVDSVTGRVVSGVDVSSEKFRLQRHVRPDFSIPTHLVKRGHLTFAAPGYEVKTLLLDNISWPLEVSLKPVDMPQWDGIAAFPKLIGDQLSFNLQLLDTKGEVMEEYPGVGLTGHVKIKNAAGAESGQVELLLVRDDTGPTIVLSGLVTLDSLKRVAGTDPKSFSVRLAAGGRSVESRAFSVPPGLRGPSGESP